MTPLARVMAEHFIGMERLLEIVRLTKTMDDPVEIIAELESGGLEKEAKPDPGKVKEPKAEKQKKKQHERRRR
jgi:helicase